MACWCKRFSNYKCNQCEALENFDNLSMTYKNHIKLIVKGISKNDTSIEFREFVNKVEEKIGDFNNYVFKDVEKWVC